jgi:hypothetical protein
MSMTLISTVSMAGVNAVSFSAISSAFTDLQILVSPRSTRAGDSALGITFNTSGGSYANRRLYGTGASVFSDSQTAGGLAFLNIAGSGNTSNTFSNVQIYIPNYGSSTAKSFSADAVEESNSASTYIQQAIFASSWSGTAAISTITLYDYNGSNFDTGSIASLYGITKGSGGASVS